MAMKESEKIITPRMRESFGPLGDDLMCAYLSHQSGTAFARIKARYGTEATGQRLGDYWVFAAGRMIGEMIELQGGNSKEAKRLTVVAAEQRDRTLKHSNNARSRTRQKS